MRCHRGGASSGGGLGNDTLSGIENLIGSAYDDFLTGDGNDNVLRASKGHDHLDGGAGNDTADFSDAPGLLNQTELTRVILKPAVQTYNTGTDSAGTASSPVASIRKPAVGSRRTTCIVRKRPSPCRIASP